MPAPVRAGAARPPARRKARRGAEAQATPPEETREAPGPVPGPDDAFACFTEWASEADRAGYADL
ncbi:MAG: hypothetical protein Q8M19_00815 [Reyranella sp.]|nr:hypothetical protein [Reyranella sp.]